MRSIVPAAMPVTPRVSPDEGVLKALRAPAQVQMGRIAMMQHNPAQARRWFTMAASTGDPQALYDLGTMAWNGDDGHGHGQGRNASEANRLWRQADTHGQALTHEVPMGLIPVPRR